ncbi:MAG: RnfABCDGE type electron transport complex subunit G [Gammaproteobacteria bacterium]|nr:RnfABCDGE type electron transport complex subunit G [Gammaproteobacteria bacterium]
MQIESALPRLAPVLVVFLAGTILLVLINSRTEHSITENERQQQMDMMALVLPPAENGNYHFTLIELDEPELTGPGRTLYVYKQWNGDQVTGISMYPVIARGYSGRIVLSVGITPDNQVSGVRVIEQNETTGLGDLVHQDNSDWIRQFRKLSPSLLKTKDWAISKDQGKFDVLSGATITSRAVINAVHKAVEIHAIRKETIYSSE